MESRCKASVIMASSRSGGGVRWRGDELQLLGHRSLFVVALLFVTVTTFVIEDVHCSITTDAVAPAPTPSTQQTQPIVTFNQYEADALSAIFRSWKEQNPQLSTLLNWSLEQHPCNNLTLAFEKTTGNDFNGAWTGVGCTSQLQNITETPKHYQITVTSLEIYGTNSSCGTYIDFDQCGFDGIIGQLPPEISNLTNLQYLGIIFNPQLTGPVPAEIFQMPYLVTLDLYSNSLSGTLPSDVYNANCAVESIDLSNNNFTGSLRVSSQGTLFCSSLEQLVLINNYLSGTLPSDVYNANCTLKHLDLSNNNFTGSLRLSSQGTLFCSTLERLYLNFNQLNGPINFQNWNYGTGGLELYLSNNYFKGTFSTGPYFDVSILDLSNNDLSNIQLANYIGDFEYTNSSPICMPSLLNLNISSNNFGGLFPEEIFGMSSLRILDLSKNNFFGSIDFQVLNTSIQIGEMYINDNNFNGTFFTSAYLNPYNMDLSNNRFNNITFHEYIEYIFPNSDLFVPALQKVYLQNNSLKGQFPAHILTSPSLKVLDASQNQYQTLQLPNVQIENSSLSQISLTNNELSLVKYSTIGPFTAYNLQYSSLLFLGGNPKCNKIKDLVSSSICRFDPLDQAPLVKQQQACKKKQQQACKKKQQQACKKKQQ